MRMCTPCCLDSLQATSKNCMASLSVYGFGTRSLTFRQMLRSFSAAAIAGASSSRAGRTSQRFRLT